MEEHRDTNADTVQFASSLCGVDFRLYSKDRQLQAARVAHQSPASLESADGLTEDMVRALSDSIPGDGLIHVDCFGRSWACAELKDFILTAGPFLRDDDSEAAIAAVLRHGGISHASLADYYRSLPIRDNPGAAALVKLLLLLENGVPSAKRITIPVQLSSPVHDPSLEERIRAEQDEIESLYALERRILEIVETGDRKALGRVESHPEHYRPMRHLEERMPENPLRLQRNLSIALNTLLRQAAGRGGLSPLSLHGISERFAVLIERSGSLHDINLLRRDMIRSYTDAVGRLGVAGHSRPVRLVLQYINDHLDGEFFLKDLALEAGLHPVSLSRLFRKENGITITAHIRKRRMEEARWFLSNRDFSIQDTALMVGYEDSGAFSKAFKREIGITPGKYRFMKT